MRRSTTGSCSSTSSAPSQPRLTSSVRSACEPPVSSSPTTATRRCRTGRSGCTESTTDGAGASGRSLVERAQRAGDRRGAAAGQVRERVVGADGDGHRQHREQRCDHAGGARQVTAGGHHADLDLLAAGEPVQHGDQRREVGGGGDVRAGGTGDPRASARSGARTGAGAQRVGDLGRRRAGASASGAASSVASCHSATGGGSTSSPQSSRSRSAARTPAPQPSSATWSATRARSARSPSRTRRARRVGSRAVQPHRCEPVEVGALLEQDARLEQPPARAGRAVLHRHPQGGVHLGEAHQRGPQHLGGRRRIQPQVQTHRGDGRVVGERAQQPHPPLQVGERHDLAGRAVGGGGGRRPRCRLEGARDVRDGGARERGPRGQQPAVLLGQALHQPCRRERVQPGVVERCLAAEDGQVEQVAHHPGDELLGGAARRPAGVRRRSEGCGSADRSILPVLPSTSSVVTSWSGTRNSGSSSRSAPRAAPVSRSPST